MPKSKYSAKKLLRKEAELTGQQFVEQARRTSYENQAYYVVSLAHTKPEHRYITFWRPNHRGYAWPLPWAGLYRLAMGKTDKEVTEREADLKYLNAPGHTMMIKREAVDALGAKPNPGDIDGDVGPVVKNTQENWDAICKAALVPMSVDQLPELFRKVLLKKIDPKHKPKKAR